MYLLFYFLIFLTILHISTMNVRHFHFPPLAPFSFCHPFFLSTLLRSYLLFMCGPPSECRVTCPSMDQKLFIMAKASSLWLQHWRNWHSHLSTSYNCPQFLREWLNFMDPFLIIVKYCCIQSGKSHTHNHGQSEIVIPQLSHVLKASFSCTF